MKKKTWIWLLCVGLAALIGVVASVVILFSRTRASTLPESGDALTVGTRTSEEGEETAAASAEDEENSPSTDAVSAEEGEETPSDGQEASAELTGDETAGGTSAVAAEPPQGEILASGVEESEQALFAVYRDVLEQNRTEILDYTWQNREDKTMKPVAFRDITGDGFPEMFYITAVCEVYGENTIYAYARLHILSYRDGYVYEAFLYDHLDYQAGGGMYYTFFKDKGRDDLYARISEGDDWYEISYFRADAGDGGTMALTELAVLSESWNDDRSGVIEKYSLDGAEVDEDEFSALVDGLEQSMDVLLSNESECFDDASAMTYSDAMTYVIMKTDPEVRKQDLSACLGEYTSLDNVTLNITEVGDGTVTFCYSVYRLFSTEPLTGWINGENKISFYDYSQGGSGDLILNGDEIELIIDAHSGDSYVFGLPYDYDDWEHTLTRELPGIDGFSFELDYAEEDGRYIFSLDTDCPADEETTVSWSWSLDSTDDSLDAEEVWHVYEEGDRLILETTVDAWEIALYMTAAYQNSTGRETRSGEFFFMEKQMSLIPHFARYVE